MPKREVRALIFVQPQVGRTRLLVEGAYVKYQKGQEIKYANLAIFVDTFIDMDPVLELEDGCLVRVCQGGEPSSIRAEAQGILDSYRL